MRSLFLLCACGALLAGCVRKSELDRAQGEIAVLQEKIRLLGRQRVPRAELDQSQATAVAAQERVAALAQELAVTREQLSGAQVQLVAAREKVTALDRPASAAAEARAPGPVVSLGLVKGSYTQKDDTLVYSRDAQLNFANGVTISSPSGLMLSDKDREIVAGDLVVETPRSANAPATDPAVASKPKEPADRSSAR